MNYRLESVRKKRKIKKTIKKIIFLGLYFILLFILIEGTLRLVYPQPTLKHTSIEASPQIFNKSSYLPWQLKPNTEINHSNMVGEFDVEVSINSLGYRDNEFPIEKQENEQRILVMGDSFTFGFGVELDEIYVKNLEKLIKDYSVINAGYKSGNNPETYNLYLKKEGLLLKPDLVMLGFFIGNDFDDYEQYSRDSNEIIKGKIHYVDELNRLRLVNKPEPSTFKKIFHKVNNLSFYSHFYVLFKNSFKNILNLVYFEKPGNGIFSENYNNDTKQNIKAVLDLLLKIKNTAQENNIPLLIVLIPTKEQAQDMRIIDKENNQLNWTKPNEILKNFAKENNIEIIDLLPSFREHYTTNKTKVYFDVDSHWNKEGHKIASKAIHKELINKKLI